MRHPSENYIKYLMTGTNQNSRDDSWIAWSVEAIGLPKPELDYLTGVRVGLMARIPSNFSPTDRYHRDSVRFMRSESIYGLHIPDDASREANLIATDLRARPLVENLLLGHIDPKDIAKKINARLSLYYTAAGIEAYGKYFWNVDLLSVEEWSKLLEKYDIKKSNTLAILQVGPAMALHLSGFQQHIESKVMLREMLSELYFDFRQWKTMPASLDRTRAITNLSKAAVLLDERLSQADSAIKESLLAFEKFRMQHADRMVQDVKEVAPLGNYSGSGARLLEASTPVITTQEVK